jgi:hypothetical protein
MRYYNTLSRDKIIDDVMGVIFETKYEMVVFNVLMKRYDVRIKSTYFENLHLTFPLVIYSYKMGEGLSLTGAMFPPTKTFAEFINTYKRQY